MGTVFSYIGKILALPRIFFVWIITFYQKTLSPDHSWVKAWYPAGFCRYHPTCSEYAKEAIVKKGAIVGIPMALWRVLRCNPWSKGGNDPVL